MPKLSLIMPAYNAETTCELAIESALCNDYDLEIIVVDDGSTDNTYQICRDFQHKDNRVRTYTQTNGGVSSARNYGMSLANGDYIGFIDADDKLGNDYVQRLFVLMETAPDIIVFGYSNMVQGKRVSGWKPIETDIPMELFDDLLWRSGGLNSPWNKLFKRSILRHTFNTDKNMGEDLEFCCEYLKQITTCKTLPLELYVYNTDAVGSLTKKMNIVLDSIVDDMNVLLDFINSVGFDAQIIPEKFYQRVEGILGSIEGYADYRKAVAYLFHKKEFLSFLETFQPRNKKNRIIRNLLYWGKWKYLYVYLWCKRCVRKVVR